MVILKTKIQCFRWKKKVDKNETRVNKSVNGEPRHECFTCFKRYRRDPLLAGVEEIPYKKDYYCQRCNYKFKSKLNTCPYCSKNDLVIGGNVSLKELM